MNWEINKRKEMLFQQIIGVGAVAFLTNRANIKPDPAGKGGVQYDKKSTWNVKIIEPLKQAAEFADAKWPEDHQAVLNYIERIILKNKHLYTPGEEQNEPADAGTEGTKDEKFSDWQKAIIDVHKLMEDAETITAENKTKKAGAAASDDARHEAAQDASAQSAYGSDGKRNKRRKSPEPDSSKHKAITVVKWAEEANRNDAEVLAECRAGKVPAGFRFVDVPDDQETDDKVDRSAFTFQEPYLTPTSVEAGSSSSGGLRDDIRGFLNGRTESKSAALELEKVKETNRANERNKELEVLAVKARSEASAQANAQKAQAFQQKLMVAMMKKAGVDIEIDEDD